MLRLRAKANVLPHGYYHVPQSPPPNVLGVRRDDGIGAAGSLQKKTDRRCHMWIQPVHDGIGIVQQPVPRAMCLDLRMTSAPPTLTCRQPARSAPPQPDCQSRCAAYFLYHKPVRSAMRFAFRMRRRSTRLRKKRFPRRSLRSRRVFVVPYAVVSFG
jgi:hypothetical protein